MKTELIIELFDKFEKACYVYNGLECWSARELQEIFEYSNWVNFVKVIEKAKIACENADSVATDHFADVDKMVEVGSGAERKIQDVALTRYACYLIAQNGDPAKNPVAFAQTYFAVQTRRQEIVEKRLLDVARVTAREKLSKSENKLSKILYERGVDHGGFAGIRSKGDQALFGGFSTSEMKQKLSIPENRPLADFLPTLIIKAKDFATELTSHNVVDKDLQGEDLIAKEHIDNNKAVRKMLKGRGVLPEELPAVEDVKKVQRQLANEEKAIAKSAKSKTAKARK
jgi:DNA-damage-inducible protein D